MKSRNKIGKLALCIILLVACKISSYAQLNDTARYNTIRRALERSHIKSTEKPDIKLKYNDDGSIIDLDIALRCISLFKPEMLKHKIMDTKSIKYTAQRTMIVPRMITTAEVFGGLGLLDWIAETINKVDSTGGNNVGIKLVYGIYTEELLNTLNRFANAPEQKAKRKDRISTFLFPCDKNKKDCPVISHSSPYIKKELRTNDQTIDSPTAYELGGLEP